MSGIEHVLGLDGGGSRTRCMIADLSGHLLARGDGGPSNPLTVGADSAAEAIQAAVAEASSRCGIRRFKASCLGIAGTERASAIEALKARLGGLGLGSIRIVSDAEVALAGATGCGPGVVVISGTGSIAYGVNEDGVTARAGGWGWRLGDEGSGYDIGNKGLIAALRAYDGRGPETVLERKVGITLGLGDMRELVDRIYVEGMGREEVAELAALVGEAAEEGDLVALWILEEAGSELGLAALSVVRRLGMKGMFPLALTGGVFNLGAPLRDALKELVRREAPGCVVGPPHFDPEVGAALLAFQDIGVALDEELMMRVEASYETLRGGSR